MNFIKQLIILFHKIFPPYYTVDFTIGTLYFDSLFGKSSSLFYIYTQATHTGKIKIEAKYPYCPEQDIPKEHLEKFISVTKEEAIAQATKLYKQKYSWLYE